MVKKLFVSLFLAVLTIAFVIPTNGASANTIDEGEINEVKPFINVFDENGKLVKSYNEKEMEQFYVNENQIAVPKFGVQKAQFPPTPKTYNFPKTTIKNNIWVNGGSTFYDLKSIFINTNTKFKSLYIGVFKSGKKVHQMEVGGFTGGLSVPLKTYSMSEDYYSIQLYNPYPENGSIVLTGGTVFYDKK
ncbi:hypothetical protein [Bacillus wiedmannii]|uniref:hypothetical protein n=1 Tax=Bacillus wiedmannii TaxID=1890302 RepID=UPI00086F2678|nr:hypothetical protein [Bacillus wiedmannii]SCN41833.1 Uncharacterized protein BCRIVMBC938_05982 [Bacillus wiedmannii]